MPCGAQGPSGQGQGGTQSQASRRGAESVGLSPREGATCVLQVGRKAARPLLCFGESGTLGCRRHSARLLIIGEPIAKGPGSLTPISL